MYHKQHKNSHKGRTQKHTQKKWKKKMNFFYFLKIPNKEKTVMKLKEMKKFENLLKND
jgi:hypothetical protein